jgi:hypothetical protein
MARIGAVLKMSARWRLLKTVAGSKLSMAMRQPSIAQRSSRSLSQASRRCGRALIIWRAISA